MESVATTWFIELFGGPRAVCGEKSIDDFRTERCGRLLAILAARPERMHTRGELGELLWPDEDEQLQRRRLKDELSKLHTDLGEYIFEKRGNVGVKMRSGITSDVSRFDQLFLTAARATSEQRLPALEAAVTLYKEDLLPRYYDDWVIRERERLKVVYCDVLTRLVLDLEAVGRTDEASIWRRELVSRFPDQVAPPAPTTAGTPAQSGDGYYGREEDILAVRQWRGRLLTLTGPGGMGKTRLSKQALSPPTPTSEGAVFVPLAEVSDAKSGFFEAIHVALALPKGELPPRDQVVYALSQRAAPLLILDNFEQIVTHGAPLVARLLKDVPNLRCLVTSRRPLGIAGEQVHKLEPLSHAPSVALFLDRARRARPDFALSPSAGPIVEEIVELLERLPLAIELAAARSVVLGPMQMRDQLASRLRFLVNRRHATSERHRSLRAALDWSIHLLSPELRRIFARLSVFRGGWSLEAAETVCKDCGMEVLDAIDELESHSLITVTFDPETETSRYDMLVVIREYAEELLAESGELEETKAQHAQSVEEMAQRVEVCRKEQGVGPMQRLLARDVENLRRGMDWAEKAERYDLLNSWLGLLGGKLFEGGHWRDFEHLLGLLDGKIEDKRDFMCFYKLRGGLLRRLGRDNAAANDWEKWLELIIELKDNLLWLAIFQIVDLYLDCGDYEKIEFYLKRYINEVGWDLNYELLLLKKRLRFDSSVNCEEVVTRYVGLCSKDFAQLSSHIFISIDTLQDENYFDQIICWVDRLLQEDGISKNKFIVAKIFRIIGVFLERENLLDYSYSSFFLSAQYHRLLGSRSITRSQELLQEFLDRHPIAPIQGLYSHSEICDTVHKIALVKSGLRGSTENLNSSPTSLN